MIHGDILIRVMNIKIRRFVRQPQALRDGLIRRGGDFKMQDFFLYSRVEILFFLPDGWIVFF